MRSDPSPSRLSFTREAVGDVEVVTLSGEIDLHTVPVLEEAIESADPATDLSVDLASVTFLDSAGLRAIVAAHERQQQNGVSLTVSDPSDAARRVLEITGLADLLGVNGA